MSQFQETYSPPGAPISGGPVSSFEDVRGTLNKIALWMVQKSSYDALYLQRLQSSFNQSAQGFGQNVTSAATIRVTDFMHIITGSAAISNILPPMNFNGFLALIAQTGFTLTTGGNIAQANGVPANALALLIYFPPTGIWYTIAVSVPDGSITTAKLAPGAASEMATTVDNTSQNIAPYDTPVTVVSETVTINATTDQVHVTGRINTTSSNVQGTNGGDGGSAFLYRDAVLLDTAPIKLTLSTAAVIGGQSSTAFSYFDSGVVGAHVYSIKLQIHNGSLNTTFALNKDSAALIVMDMRAQ